MSQFRKMQRSLTIGVGEQKGEKFQIRPRSREADAGSKSNVRWESKCNNPNGESMEGKAP